MSLFTRSAIGVLTCVLLVAPMYADDVPKKLSPDERKELEAKWEDLNSSAKKSLQAKRFDEAKKSLADALQTARQLFPHSEFPDGHKNLAESLNNMAFCYYVQEKYQDAEPLFCDALDMRQKLFDKYNPVVISTINNLAFTYKAQRKFPEAEQLLRDALARNKHLVKGDHVRIIQSMNDLAIVYRDWGKYAQAEVLFRDALDMVNRMFNGDHPYVAGCLNNLALLLNIQGKFVEAEPLSRDALAMNQRLLKGDHPNVANGLNNLALICWNQRKFEEAEPLFRDALAMNKRLFKGDHADLANSLNSLAGLYWGEGKYRQAEPLFRAALAMNKRLFKGDHPQVAANLSNLAVLLKNLGNYAEAEALHRDALDMRKRLFKRDHPDLAQSLNEQADLLKDLGKYAEAEALHRDALDMRKRLFKGDHPDLAQSLTNLGLLYQVQGKYTESEAFYRESISMNKRMFNGYHRDIARSMNNLASCYYAQGKFTEAEDLYNTAMDMNNRVFKTDHPQVAACLSSLANLHMAQGKFTDAERLYRHAFTMRKRLFQGDHPDLAESLNNLAGLYRNMGKYIDSELLLRDYLDMHKRIHNRDHPDIVASLSNLAILYGIQRKYVDSESLHRDALDMNRRLFQGDHPQTAMNLIHLADLCKYREQFAEAEALYSDAFQMRKRLFKGDHPDLVQSVNNLAGLYEAQGKYADADMLYRDALAMNRRLFGNNHPNVAINLTNLAFLYLSQEQFSESEVCFSKALDIYQRFIANYAWQKSDGELLTFIASLPLIRDGYLSNARQNHLNPLSVYTQIWASKGLISRVYEQRHLHNRAAVAIPQAAKLLAELADARRQRAELIYVPQHTDSTDRAKRDEAIKSLERKIEELNQYLCQIIPTLERSEKLAKIKPTELWSVLPAEAAVVDFLRYVYFEQDKDRPGRGGTKRSDRYLAFIVTKNSVKWIDLGPAEKIEPAVTAWRKAIIGDSALQIPPARTDTIVELGRTVRELVWEKVQNELPAKVTTVYISPDAALCRVPWAAIPGHRPDTILLDEYSVATIPHTAFLIDKLWPQDIALNPPTEALIVGGVTYDAELSPPGVNLTANRSEPLLNPRATLSWPSLPGTVAEANGVRNAATTKKLTVTLLSDKIATTPAILAKLPNAKYTHFATHGFFADSSFRSIFQLDENDYKQTLFGQRIGRAANSPLVMTGLVFAGANDPKTPGRGIVTGESLIDLDLSGLELAVLSACETGLGDVAGGEGSFGLQRAFHMAGTRDVVVSLWKVPDESTAALMGLFYQNLWTRNLSPMESLRQAQLEIYRNPGKIPELAKGFRGTFKEVAGTPGVVEIKPGTDGKAHPLLWAAFTLSGPGR